jgi:hypothetical protein
MEMKEKIGGYSEGHLLNVAKGVVEKKTKDSKILDVEKDRAIPKFDLNGRNTQVVERLVFAELI